jgi:hypothetical protein
VKLWRVIILLDGGWENGGWWYWKPVLHLIIKSVNEEVGTESRQVVFRKPATHVCDVHFDQDSTTCIFHRYLMIQQSTIGNLLCPTREPSSTSPVIRAKSADERERIGRAHYSPRPSMHACVSLLPPHKLPNKARRVFDLIRTCPSMTPPSVLSMIIFVDASPHGIDSVCRGWRSGRHTRRKERIEGATCHVGRFDVSHVLAEVNGSGDAVRHDHGITEGLPAHLIVMC